MCKWNKWGDTRIDPCMREFIRWLGNKHRILACCCGHGKYPMTVVVKEFEKEGVRNVEIIKEVFSGKIIPRKKKFYVRDKQGVYYIPEVVNGN